MVIAHETHMNFLHKRGTYFINHNIALLDPMKIIVDQIKVPTLEYEKSIHHSIVQFNNIRFIFKSIIKAISING